MIENHKCRVYKIYDIWFPWVTQCSVDRCLVYRGFIQSNTWEEAMLEALHHRMRNNG